MPVRNFKIVVMLAALMLGGSLSAFGQAVTATLVGTVSDPAKASVNNAQVKITEQQTGASLTQTTNDSGNYQFTFLPPGVYTVTVTMHGFQAQTTKDVPVPVNTTARLDVTLQAGSVEQSITVTDSAPLLQTDRSDISTQFETKQVEDLPLGSNRNFQGMQQLVPGMSTPIYDHSAFFDSQNSMSFHANGQSEMVNNLQVEGVDDNQRGGLLQVYIPPAAAIQTVDVETANYAPEFGRAGGAVTNVTMKSGTNRFHGSAYAYNGVSATAARTYFNRTGIFPRYTNNYDGGTFGGPIFKNRTFIFGDFLRYSNVSSVYSLFSVPSAAFRAGDLRTSPTPIYDPATGNPDGTGRTQFVSDGSNVSQGIPIGTKNVIPQTRLVKIPQSVLALIPLPNIPGAGNTSNFQESVVLSQISETFDIKVDQNVGEKDHLTGRYSREVVDTNQHPAFGNAGGPAAGGYEGIGTDTTWVAAVEYTHIFSPSLFAEGRFGVNYFDNVQQPSDYGLNTANELGIPNINNGLTSSGVPNFTINGYSAPIVGYQAFIPETDPQTNIDGVLNVTKVLGNHSLKFGAETRVIRDDITQGQVFGTRGAYVYADGQTGTPGVTTSYGNDMASFLLDQISSAGIDINVNDASFRQKMYFLFAQDTWQATSKLTLTYGLRWEYYAPPTPKAKGGFSQYNPADNSLSVAGYGGIPMDLGVTKNLKNFQPRVGFAYRANPSLVVRGGFGVASSPFPDKFYAYNYPVKQNISINSTSSYIAAPVTLAQGFPTAATPTIPSNGIIPSSVLLAAGPTLNNSSWVSVNKNYHDPVVASFNLAVEQSLGHNWVMTLAYVGNQGRHIPGNYNLNAGLTIGAGAAGQPEFATFGRTAATELLPKGTSENYNSLQARVEHRFASGFTWLSSFAWQKAMGFNSTGGGLAGYNFYIDPHRDYAPLAWDTRNTYAESFVYELPFGKNKMMLQHGIASKLAGGWEVSSLLGMQTGTPLFFSASSTALNAPGTTQVPNQVGPFRKLKGIGAGHSWFDTTAFVAPPSVIINGVKTPTQGNVGKNVYSGPGQVQFNASVFRTFPIHEAVNFQFRVDALNALNHPTFSNPSTDMTSSSFGQITGTSASAAAGNNAAPGRTLQLAGTISF
jgi:hypothetical protein